ncbi:substrate-binding domain-containing protein [Stagnimonas aquatica]|nr:substrate-binding domain-containing protein [Stagnimonas aquatica]
MPSRLAMSWLPCAPGLLLSWLLLAAPVQAQEAASSSVTVITSPGLPAQDLSRATLQAIYLMRLRQWPDGTPIRVFVLPEGSQVHDHFAREKLGTYPYILQRTWDRLVFTGTGLAPEQVHSEDEMRQKVMSTKGAIGYLSAGPQSWLGVLAVARIDHEERTHVGP